MTWLAGKRRAGTYRLLTYNGELSGFPRFSYAAPAGSGQTGGFDTATAGVISVTISGGAASLPSLTVAAREGQLIVGWPEAYLGWRLQAQTNTLAAGWSTNWVTVSGSEASNQTAFPIDTACGSVLFRLISP